MKILIELRPALEGHSGIPQEARLLFRGLALLPEARVAGLLQSSSRLVGKGLPAAEAASDRWTEDKRINRLSRVVVSLQPGKGRGIAVRLAEYLGLGIACTVMVLRRVMGRRETLTRFLAAPFSDFVWRALFAKTLPPQDREAMTSAEYRVARVPWAAAHAVGVLTRKFGAAVYPRFDTRDFDLMIAETPYPGRVSRPTRLVVRYHDAFPLLMPHTITDRSHHQASHYQALRRNVLDGAWFACVSDATRADLVSVFPEVAERAVTIPNMVSHRYFLEDSPPGTISQVLRTRANRKVANLVKRRGFFERGGDALRDDVAPEYVLMVSTLEPRKNHLGLLAAWEQLRSNGRPDLQLVLVGMLGWDHKDILNRLLPWIGRGLVHLLDDVPAAELRALYRHARATVCPSFGEGFGFSGVEAMCCGGVVAASDLPVHREIYGGAAVFFDPYSTGSMADSVERIIGAGDEAEALRGSLRVAAVDVSSKYYPEKILPRWQEFLETLSRPRA